MGLDILGSFSAIFTKETTFVISESNFFSFSQQRKSILTGFPPLKLYALPLVDPEKKKKWNMGMKLA